MELKNACARTPAREEKRTGMALAAIRGLEESAEEDPLSRDQVLSSIRAAKRLHLPTATALRAVRRQIDED